MKWSDIKNYLKKFWNFLWHEDSLLSWTVNIIVAFILIKFIIYPGLGILLGTNLPVVAVISESMTHEGTFDQWWDSNALCGEQLIIFSNYTTCSQKEWYAQKGITKDEFLNYPMHNGFRKGDIIVLKGISYEDIKVGEIIVFQSKMAYPIIHRVVEKNDVIQTKGDHNSKQIEDPKLNEKYVTKTQIIGKAWIKIPWLGYIKIWAVDVLQCITFQGCSFK